MGRKTSTSSPAARPSLEERLRQAVREAGGDGLALKLDANDVAELGAILDAVRTLRWAWPALQQAAQENKRARAAVLKANRETKDAKDRAWAVYRAVGGAKDRRGPRVKVPPGEALEWYSMLVQEHPFASERETRVGWIDHAALAAGAPAAECIRFAPATAMKATEAHEFLASCYGVTPGAIRKAVELGRKTRQQV